MTAKRRPPKRPTRRNPSEQRALNRAKAVSRMVNGARGNDVIELREEERRLPKYLAVVGELAEMTYRPNARSTRGSWDWTHASGDRGALQAKGKRKPVLAVDPKTKRPYLIPFGSAMRLTKRGLVG